MLQSDGDRRRAVREKVFEVSIITAQGVEHRAHLLDVSATGARAHCRHRFVVGQPVTVRSAAITHRAQVCWVQDDGKCGLRFL